MWGPGAVARVLIRLFGRYALRRGRQLATSPEARERLRAWLDTGNEGEGGMFERFDDEARRTVVIAQEEARELAHEHVGTEHILLALLSGDTTAAAALGDAGVEASLVEEEVRRLAGVGPDRPTGQIPFTPETKRLLHLALREAFQLGADEVRPEHLLLTLIREKEGLGMQVLLRLDVDPSSVRRHALQRAIDARASTEPVEGSEPVDAAEGRRDPGPDRTVDEVVRRLEAIEERLTAIEARLDRREGE